MAAGCRLLRGGGAAVSILLPTLAAFVLPPAPVGAAPSLTMWVDSTRAALGTPIGLTIRLRYEQGAAPRVPDLSTLIKDALVRPLASEPELVGVGQVEVDLRYDLRFYQLGHQRIPEIEVVFTRSAGDTSIRTAGPVEVEIVAVREVDDIELRDIKPPVAVPGGIPVWLAVVVVLVALIVAAGLIWRSRRRPGVGHALPPPALPVDYAAEFTRIAAMGLLERGAFKVYYSLLSQTLWRFLEQRCPGLAAVEQTTEEIARAVEAIAAPDLGEMLGFKVYKPKIDIHEESHDGLYVGTKSFEYILLPETSGNLVIPAVEYAFFDPLAAVYQTVRTEELRVEIWGEGPAIQSSRYQLTRQEIEELGEDIRHIKPDVTQLAGGDAYLHQKVWFWALQALMPLAYAGAMLFHRHRRRLQGDEAYARRRRARGEGRRRLRQAEVFREEGDCRAFCSEVQQLVLAFIADHLNRSASGLTAHERRELLALRGAPAGLLRATDQLLERCDFARFSSVATGDAEMKELQAQAEETIVRLEEALR